MEWGGLLPQGFKKIIPEYLDADDRFSAADAAAGLRAARRARKDDGETDGEKLHAVAMSAMLSSAAGNLGAVVGADAGAAAAAGAGAAAADMCGVCGTAVVMAERWLTLCDGRGSGGRECDTPFHATCLTLVQRRELPDGCWHCPRCAARHGDVLEDIDKPGQRRRSKRSRYATSTGGSRNPQRRRQGTRRRSKRQRGGAWS